MGGCSGQQPSQARASSRRMALRFAGVGMLATPFIVQTSRIEPRSILDDWLAFRSSFISSDGRVVDNGNGGISHSEGQGLAMLVASFCDDREAYELLCRWTLNNLSRPSDRLLRWRSQPGGIRVPSDDHNASDGDILVAWALARGSQCWNLDRLHILAIGMAEDILRLNVINCAGHPIIIPGTFGFDRINRWIVNPSYFIFPAIPELRRLLPDPRWLQLEASGLRLVSGSAFGAQRLPADWISLPKNGGRPELSLEWPPRFSWDAVRIPLYMAWAGFATWGALTPVHEFWRPGPNGHPRAWVDLKTGVVAPYPAPAGIVAISRLLAAARVPGSTLTWPPTTPRGNYYDAALYILARIAADEIGLSRGGNWAA